MDDLDPRSLAGRAAIVTGASREIGAAMARRLAAHGAAVLVAHHAEPELADETVAGWPGRWVVSAR